MNIPMSWIREYAGVQPAGITQYTDRLTMIGQKVEAVATTGESIKNVVTGKIVSIEKHENADKLLKTVVDVGAEKPLSIVTGADNITVGAVVPVAVDGAVLADGTQIKTGELRGVLSEGMLCSIEELGFTKHDFPEAPENGIYIFEDSNTKPGEDVCDVLQLRQEIVEYEITSNRPDCFSVTGIAREAAAAYNVPFTMPDLTVQEKAGGNADEYTTVEIENSNLCPRYIARIIKNVKIAPSPLWMRRRLASAGVRPINNIVDITNYVMLEIGQPMHAFDLDFVEGGIIVKTAKDGEQFTTLDGVKRTLDSSMLVISDHKKPIAIAGVMGGENSKITGGAGAVLLESACFDGTNVRVTSKKLGLRTDASSKFEKGLDPNLAEIGVNRAAHLIELLGAGEIVKGIIDCYPEPKRVKREIPFEPEKISALLGVDISAGQMAELIKPFEIEVMGEKAVIPTFRPDIEMTADLAEEVARAYGYDNIKPEMIVGKGSVGKKTRKQLMLDKVKNVMVSSNFYEALTFSFESRDVFNKLRIPGDSELRSAIPILNPLGEGYSIMRTQAVNSMLNSLSTNYNKRNKEAYLFEEANIYKADSLPVTHLPNEEAVLIAGFYGDGADFYEAKGYVEAVLCMLGISNMTVQSTDNIPWMHPGRCADVFIEGDKIGYVGECHPECLKNYNIGKKAYIFEISVEKLYEYANIERKFKELPKYPAVERDIAVLVEDGVLASDIEKSITKNGGSLLDSLTLFDVYSGGKLDVGLKSMAYSLTFRSHEKTLTENDIAPLMDKIIMGLKEEFGGILRGPSEV